VRIILPSTIASQSSTLKSIEWASEDTNQGIQGIQGIQVTYVTYANGEIIDMIYVMEQQS
jgi:hypothetical protein